ncbi:MAG: hypothetical protein IKH26_02980 [Bacteroidaceae bacterium]|nr:hypothetical protein [Bacteroidaceae bacterium]
MSKTTIFLSFLVLLFLSSTKANGQTDNITPPQIEITRGVVVDRHTRLPISDVSICDDEKEIGRTDENGRFAIRMRTDSVSFSHISYTSMKVGKNEMTDTIPMIEQNNELGNVFIKGKQHYDIHMPPVDPLSVQPMPQGLNILPLIVKGLKALGILPKRTKHQSRIQKAKTICDNY